MDKFKKKHKGTRLNKISTAIAQAKITVGHSNDSISFIVKTINKVIISLTEAIEDFENQLNRILLEMKNTTFVN